MGKSALRWKPCRIKKIAEARRSDASRTLKMGNEMEPGRFIMYTELNAIMS